MKELHQLAAKKAIEELDESLCWLSGVKDEKDTPLETRYSGCFDEMVRREVVHLGLQYLVGGKSFVAVAGNHEDCKEIRMGQLNVGIHRAEERRPDECDSHEDMGYAFL